jgi:hypothetical protein
MDASADCLHHFRVRVLAHIKKLDDCFGQFLVRVTCPCGASRHIQPGPWPLMRSLRKRLGLAG